MITAFQATQALPNNTKNLESFGFKLTGGGAHAGRTIMLKEITQLFTAMPPHATIEQYKQTILENNTLEKSTQSTRKETFRRLRELYALSDKVPIFIIYRELIYLDMLSAPLLSLLVAWTRDPLLRATTPAIFEAKFGSEVKSNDLQRALIEAYPNTYSAYNNAKIARYTASSWTQSGHLFGRVKKVRHRVQPRPASLTLALLLAYICGWTGERLFNSPWCQLLDLNGSEARSLATQAHREELITLKVVGAIVDISFPRFDRILQVLT